MVGIFQPSSLSRKQRGMIIVPPPKTLLIGTWNINGFRSKVFGNKFEQQDVQNIIKNYDIIGFTETHTSNDITLSLPGFSVPFTKNRPKIGSQKKLSGGIAVFVKDYLIDSKSICQVQTNNQNVIWLKLKKEKFNEGEDIFIGTFYLSPENYETNKKLNYMEDLEREIFKFASKGKIVLQGDFNARCSNLQDAVIFSKYFSENNDIIDIPTNSDPNIPKRNSSDTVSNTRGKKLIDLCIMSDLNIVNGRKNGDLFGEKTCFRWNGSSLIDLVICSSSLFTTISYLQVGEFLPWLTDHCPVSFSLNVNIMVMQSTKIKLSEVPGKFLWDTEATKHFEITLQSNWVRRIKDCTIQNYFSVLKTQSKMRTYIRYKHEFSMEPYIAKLHFKARQQISKLRLSDHNLEIERGRYHRPSLKPEDRTCMFCPQKIEDEFHFLTECTAYSDERQNLVNSITRSFPNIVLFHKNKLFSIIFECNEQHSKLISSSVKKFNEIRNEKIEIRENAIIPHWLFD